MMTLNALLQLAVYLVVLVLIAKPLGWYMAKIYEGEPVGINRLLAPVERAIYRLCGTNEGAGMTWKTYAFSMLAFNAMGFAAVYAIQRLQGALPLNPQAFAGVPPDLAFNTAISFVSNTNWQAYGGETTMSYLSQMLALTTQNFVSAASGMAVLVALIRGFRARTSQNIGNFWVDMTRSVVYILLPLSFAVALFLISQGVIQNFSAYVSAQGLQSGANQLLPMGPAASQIAIKQLGTNGGGFFNANSAHPFENPTPLANFVEVVSILLIPAGLCYTFGKMVKDTRQGWAIFIAMMLIFAPLMLGAYAAEQSASPALAALNIDQTASPLQPGGNMEGKETRFGIADSAMWAVATTAASNGSVNAMHDSFTPLGGLIPMWLMQLGEVVWGGAGSGLYGMLVFAIIAVFVAGLMVGRTPEYLGKKIEAFEMKMASLIILIPPMLVLTGAALAVATEAGRAGVLNAGAHGFSEILYAFSSAGNNNGSAFAGLSANTVFYNLFLGLAMFIGRFWLAVPVLAIAGSLAAKKTAPAGSGTLPTHTPLFIVMLVSIVIVVGALTFIPALALGPIAEQLSMAAK